MDSEPARALETTLAPTEVWSVAFDVSRACTPQIHGGRSLLDFCFRWSEERWIYDAGATRANRVVYRTDCSTFIGHRSVKRVRG